jgi:hypothetical protein
MLVIAELIRLSEIVIINTLDNSLVVKDLWLIVVTITSSKHPESIVDLSGTYEYSDFHNSH